MCHAVTGLRAQVFVLWELVPHRVALVNVLRALPGQAAAQKATSLCVRQGKPCMVNSFDVFRTHRCSPCRSTDLQRSIGAIVL
jgi:hypothetical protein